jgi:hypothetical protein
MSRSTAILAGATRPSLRARLFTKLSIPRIRFFSRLSIEDIGGIGCSCVGRAADLNVSVHCLRRQCRGCQICRIFIGSTTVAQHRNAEPADRANDDERDQPPVPIRASLARSSSSVSFALGDLMSHGSRRLHTTGRDLVGHRCRGARTCGFAVLTTPSAVCCAASSSALRLVRLCDFAGFTSSAGSKPSERRSSWRHTTQQSDSTELREGAMVVIRTRCARSR